ncbi:MAG: hypothetical protein QM775_31400 [Pirellulales bacterium]
MRATAPPREIPVFDHRPTDDELSVLLPYDVLTSDLRVRRNGSRLTVELGRIPIAAVLIWMLLVMGVIAYLLVRTSTFRETGHFWIMMPMIFFGMWMMFDWLNRRADQLNPLVEFDESARTLRVPRRQELIRLDGATVPVEIVSWNLSRKQLKVHGLYPGEHGGVRQATLVLRRGEEYETVLLFHDFAGSGRSFDDPAKLLATALNVPLRRIEAK